LIGLNASDLDKLQENQSNWDEWLEKFATYHDLWAEKGFIFFFESFLQREKVRSKLLGLDGGERKLTNVLHLMEILHQQEKEEHLGQNALLSWLEENMNPDAMRLEEHELRLESDAQAVQIITIHKSKGLEYPIVFSPFLHKGSKPQPPIVFHDQEEENVLTMYLGSEYMETWQAQAEKEQLAENMRLFYVALTRAKHRCYLSWGAINKSQTSAWAHLLYGSTSSDSDFYLKELESNVDTLDKSAFKAPLEKLGSKCPAIKVTSPPKAAYDYNRTDQRQENLIPITFNRILQKNWRLSSFSALIKAQSSLEGKDQDEELQFSFTSDPLEKEQELNMHSFPRGAKSGTLLHSILEETDFQKTHPEETEKIISNKLEAYGYCLDWLPVLQDMLANLVQIPLNPAKTLRLNTVSPQERLNELEFYLPLDYLSVSKLSSVYRQFFSDHAFGNIAQRIQDLGFSPHQGFLRGFIDLIFEKQGIFYLVDWKSNHLGSEVADYHKDLLVNPIVEELYFLQYHLYTVALDAYLRSHMPGYDYQLNFGGVIYVFLRGLDIQAGPEYGVFYDLPDPEFIKQLSLTLFPENICFYAT
jgi:exodeoxyribonuclease V beta subunit